MENIALITGASTGIGRELALIHARQGGDLVVVARGEEKLLSLKEELEKQYKVQVIVLVKDLSLASAAQEIYQELQSRHIHIDFLINNAGFGGVGKFHERDWEQDLKMIQLNIVALAELCRLFLPDFVERRSGRILNVSSTASLMPGPMQAVYFASKAFVTSFSNALYEELRGSGVTVTALLPGPTESEFGKVSGMDKTALFTNLSSAADVAEAGYRGMMKGKLNVVAGVRGMFRLQLPFLPFVPKKLIMRITHKKQMV